MNTVKTLIITSLCCVLSLVCIESKAQEFSIGPKIGISQGNISVNGSEFSSGSGKLGYHAGLFARLGGNSFFLQPEVLYTNTGGEFQSTQSQNEINYSVSFNRIDTPIMLGFKIAEVFRVQAGPVLTFLLNSNVESDDSGGIVLPDYKNSTVGYQAGIGIDVSNIILDLKYEGALGKQAESIAGFPTDQRQNQLILSLGIRLF